MAVGDLTVTSTRYSTMTALVTAFDAENSGGASAGADTTSFYIVPAANGMEFHLVKVVRSLA